MKPVRVFLFLLISLITLYLASIVLSKTKITIGGKDYTALPDFNEKFNEKPDSTAYFANLKKIEESKSLQQRKAEILKKPSSSTADT